MFIVYEPVYYTLYKAYAKLTIQKHINMALWLQLPIHTHGVTISMTTGDATLSAKSHLQSRRMSQLFHLLPKDVCIMIKLSIIGQEAFF